MNYENAKITIDFLFKETSLIKHLKIISHILTLPTNKIMILSMQKQLSITLSGDIIQLCSIEYIVCVINGMRQNIFSFDI